MKASQYLFTVMGVLLSMSAYAGDVSSSHAGQSVLVVTSKSQTSQSTVSSMTLLLADTDGAVTGTLIIDNVSMKVVGQVNGDSVTIQANNILDPETGFASESQSCASMVQVLSGTLKISGNTLSGTLSGPTNYGYEETCTVTINAEAN